MVWPREWLERWSLAQIEREGNRSGGSCLKKVARVDQLIRSQLHAFSLVVVVVEFALVVAVFVEQFSFVVFRVISSWRSYRAQVSIRNFWLGLGGTRVGGSLVLRLLIT